MSSGLEVKDKFLIASFTKPPQVHYLRISDPVWRPLVAEGLEVPGAVCVDVVNLRLFVSDREASKVYWYQLDVLPDQKLIAQSHPRLAADKVLALGLAVDGTGSLYMAGELLEPFEGHTPVKGILKMDVVKLEVSTPTKAGGEPHQIWTQENTDLTGDGNSPQLYEPSSIGLDKFRMFWGNYLRGPESGVVVRASMSVPVMNPLSQVEPLADNLPEKALVTCLAVTPASVFYGVNLDPNAESGEQFTGEGNTKVGAVYGLSKSKTGISCGKKSDEKGSEFCPLIANLESPTAMAWDSDATVYLASGGVHRGAIRSFASGSVTPHVLEDVIDAKGIFGLTILDASASAAFGAHR